MKTEHDKMKGRFACSSLVALTSAAAWPSSIQPVARAQIVEPAFGNPLARVRHIIVIYQENWSFDSLYGKFSGANGFAYSFPTIPQFDLNGNSICQLPQPIGNNGSPDPRFPANLPVLPYDMTYYVPADQRTGDIIHRFYHEWLQIDGGKMDKFVTWSDNGGLVFSYIDATRLPEGRVAQQYVFNDLAGGTLPRVSFIKPIGRDNEHPGYANLVAGQMHVAALVRAVQSSQFWATCAIVVTYDENGGRWDLVSPPLVDSWGPGTRVPAIIISPFAKKGHVDHTQYETVSILKFIEKRFGLAPLSPRDANPAVNDLTNAFDFGVGLAGR